MRGAGWRRYLLAVLLTASLADVSGDLSDDDDIIDPSADSRSGYVDLDAVDDSNESRAEDDEVESFVENVPKPDELGYLDHDDNDKNIYLNPANSAEENNPNHKVENRDRVLLDEYVTEHKDSVTGVNVIEAEPIQNNDHPESTVSDRRSGHLKHIPVYVVMHPQPHPRNQYSSGVHPLGYEYSNSGMNAVEHILNHHEHPNDYAEDSLTKVQYVDSSIPRGPVVHDELIFPKNPTYETIVLDEDPYATKNTLASPTIFKPHKIFSKLIPFDKHILLDSIQGAENIIKCTKEGEIHNFWAPDFQCLVCVCLPQYGSLRPVCVSCQSCMTPSPVSTTPIQVDSITTSTPPLPPEHVSCKPLPVDVMFPSPMDPCKLCICTETYDQLGEVDVRIKCQHNPQCVLPTTHKPSISTPVPLPICDKFPPHVPFPHPHDACKTCQCAVTRTPHGLMERQVVCDTSPECQPSSTTQAPHRDVTDLPPPEICDRYPEDVLFPHPRDRCQVCKCFTRTGLVFDKKTITCYIRPNCIPDSQVTVKPEPAPTPVPTTSPEPEPQPDDDPCADFPLDTHFPWPSDPCRMCKCHKDPFQTRAQLTCFVESNCDSTTTPPKPDNGTCAPLPNGIVFQHPLSPCQICLCSESATAPHGDVQVFIKCRENPECVLPPDYTTLSPDISNRSIVPDCKKFPENVYFPHPSDECQSCKCNLEQRGPLSPPEPVMSCVMKTECLAPPPSPSPPSTTLRPPTPEPIRLCDRHPDNVVFLDPRDQCKLCKCFRDPKHGMKRIITCVLRPECKSIQKPTTTTTPEPEPKIETCAPLPSNTPFQSPVDPCQVCTCTERADLSGRHEVKIQCQRNPQCFVPPDNVIPNVIIKPIRWPACKGFPPHVSVPHPRDPCQRCECSVRNDYSGKPVEQVTCSLIPECVPTTTEHHVPDDLCGRYPINTPFDDPDDNCRTCTCTRIGSASLGSGGSDGLQHSLYPPEYHMLCQTKPECLTPPTTEHTEYDVCSTRPVNTFFDDPNDDCVTCMCTHKEIGSSSLGALQNQLHPTRPTPHVQLLCHIKPKCRSIQHPTVAPITEHYPEPYEECKGYPIDMQFDDPNDYCKTCTCTQTGSTGPAGEGLGSVNPGHLFPSKYQIICQIKPECLPPTTDNPEHEKCGRYPVNTPFDDPDDQCQTCVCAYKKIGALQHPNPYSPIQPTPELEIFCFVKPECEHTTTDSITTSKPVSCSPLPSGIPFQSPVHPCQICTCTETVDVYGRPDVVFKCRHNPQCVIPDDVTTVSPDSHSTTVPTPWPPAPPGPLPGPPPHESCSPHIPNQPFQHPWDECQVCICRESISLERITIEVNCYTKPSCCIEPPIEIQGPDSVSISQIGGDNASESISGSGSYNQNYNWKHTNENHIGEADIKIIGSTGVNVIHSSGSNLIGPSVSVMHKPAGEIQTYGEKAVEYAGGSEIDVNSENWITNQGEAQIDYSDNTISHPGNLIEISSGNPIGAPDSNFIGSSSGDVIDSVGANFIGSTSGNFIGETGGNINQYGGSTGGNVIGAAGANLIGTIDGNVQNLIRPYGGYSYGSNGGHSYNLNGENSFGVSGGVSFGTKLQVNANANENLNVANRGNLLLRPLGSALGSGFVNKPAYYLKPKEVLEANAKAEAISGYNSNAASSIKIKKHYSNKMRTKSGKPGSDSDSDSESEDDE